MPDNQGYLKSVRATWNPGQVARPAYQAIFLKSYTDSMYTLLWIGYNERKGEY